MSKREKGSHTHGGTADGEPQDVGFDCRAASCDTRLTRGRGRKGKCFLLVEDPAAWLHGLQVYGDAERAHASAHFHPTFSADHGHDDDDRRPSRDGQDDEDPTDWRLVPSVVSNIKHDEVNTCMYDMLRMVLFYRRRQIDISGYISGCVCVFLVSFLKTIHSDLLRISSTH